MSKRKIKRLNKEFYVTDEYGHTDKMLVIKINELIGIVNHQQEVIDTFKLMTENNGGVCKKKKHKGGRNNDN